MQAGQLRHRVTLQSASQSTDSYGQVTLTWSDTATVWASVQPLQGREAERAKQIHKDVTHNVTIRYRSGVSTAQRFKLGSRYLNILSVLNTDERNVELVCLCMEVL